MSQLGQNNVYYRSETLLLLSPEHAQTFAAEGWSKDDVRQALYEQARVPMAAFSRENRERRLYRFMERQYAHRPDDTLVKVVQDPQDVVIVVTGGPGKHSMYLPTTGSSRSLTRAIVNADGSTWQA